VRSPRAPVSVAAPRPRAARERPRPPAASWQAPAAWSVRVGGRVSAFAFGRSTAVDSSADPGPEEPRRCTVADAPCAPRAGAAPRGGRGGAGLRAGAGAAAAARRQQQQPRVLRRRRGFRGARAGARAQEPSAPGTRPRPRPRAAPLPLSRFRESKLRGEMLQRDEALLQRNEVLRRSSSERERGENVLNAWRAACPISTG